MWFLVSQVFKILSPPLQKPKPAALLSFRKLFDTSGPKGKKGPISSATSPSKSEACALACHLLGKSAPLLPRQGREQRRQQRIHLQTAIQQQSVTPECCTHLSSPCWLCKGEVFPALSLCLNLVAPWVPFHKLRRQMNSQICHLLCFVPVL